MSILWLPSFPTFVRKLKKECRLVKFSALEFVWQDVVAETPVVPGTTRDTVSTAVLGVFTCLTFCSSISMLDAVTTLQMCENYSLTSLRYTLSPHNLTCCLARSATDWCSCGSPPSKIGLACILRGAERRAASGTLLKCALAQSVKHKHRLQRSAVGTSLLKSGGLKTHFVRHFLALQPNCQLVMLWDGCQYLTNYVLLDWVWK